MSAVVLRTGGRSPLPIQRDLTGGGFGKPLKEAASRWHSLLGQKSGLSINDFYLEMARDLNNQLGRTGVHSITIHIDNAAPLAGAFDHEFWKMTLNPSAAVTRAADPRVTAATLTRDELASLADTLVHEARHAEQHFYVARSKVRPNLAPAMLARQQKIPLTVAAKAIAAGPPTPKNASAEQLDAWESHFPGGRHYDFWDWNERQRRVFAGIWPKIAALKHETPIELQTADQASRKVFNILAPNWALPFEKRAAMKKAPSGNKVDSAVYRQLETLIHYFTTFERKLEAFWRQVEFLNHDLAHKPKVKAELTRLQASGAFIGTSIAAHELEAAQTEVYDNYPHEADARRTGGAGAAAVRTSP